MSFLKIKNILATIAVASTIAACDNGSDCNINNVSYNRIQLYTTTDGGGNTQTGKYSYPNALTVKMVINGTDSIVINNLTGASELQLPVSYTHECDTVVFEYEEGSTDTLYVGHSNIPYFISTDCGMAMYHKLTTLQYTGNMIDSAAINDPTINFSWHENIKLYIAE